MTDIAWQEPPAPEPTEHDAELMAALKANPGQWALVATVPRGDMVPSWACGSRNFEHRLVKTDPEALESSWDIYVRYDAHEPTLGPVMLGGDFDGAVILGPPPRVSP